MAHYLAIDLGTSGAKAGVVDARGAVLGHAFAPTALLLVDGGGAEQDPNDWWRALVDASTNAIAKAGVSADAIEAVSVTAQWSGTVALDRDGNALGNAIIWLDSRGRDQIARLASGFPNVGGYNVRTAAQWVRLTGGGPGLAGKDSLAHILFLQDRRPAQYAKTTTFLEPKDYLNYRLTGERAATFDSIALHWVTDNRDPDDVRYDNRLLQLAAIEREKLPRLCKATDTVGTLSAEAAKALGLKPATKVIGGTPDVPSAVIGSGASRNYAVHQYIGTSSWMSTHVPFKKADVLRNMGSLPAALPGRYFLANTQESAGECLNHVRRLLDPTLAISHDELLQRAASARPGSGKLVFLPWLYGERSPIEDSQVRGGFLNLSLSSTQADIVRSVLEGVAYNARWLLKYVERYIGRVADGINLIGGGARSDLWCEIHADVLQRPVRQMADPILANVRGAGLLAAVALGHASPDEIDAHIPVARVFEPNRSNRAVYDELFTAFKASYKNNRDVMHGLNR